MSAESKKVSPWIFTVILGVVTILFALLALQSEVQLIDKKKEVEQLKGELNASRKFAEEMRAEANISKTEAEHQRMIAEELMKRFIDKSSKSNTK
jgi:hypothetical protein